MATQTKAMIKPKKDGDETTGRNPRDNNNNPPPTTNKPIQQQQQDPSLTILSIQSELHNMGKALSCPLCLSTLRSPSLLPCNHVFCHSCITTAFQPQHNRTIHKESGKHTFKNACPVCKTSCTKRSIVPADGLKDLIRGYKHALRSFGFTPVVFDPKVNLGMTQLEDTVMYSDDDDDDDDEEEEKEEGADMKVKMSSSNEKKHNRNSSTSSEKSKLREGKHSKGGMGGSKSNAKNADGSAPSLRQCHEHLEVSRGIHHVLKKVTAQLGGGSLNPEPKLSNSRSKRASDPTTTTVTAVK